ncbi:MAG: DnaJ domain-containing protein [Thermomicrobiales bacterium]
MFLGSREDVAHLGYVLGTCPKCKTQGVFTVYLAKRKITLYVIAAVPVREQHVLQCRACETRFALPPNMKDELKERLISADDLADYVTRMPPPGALGAKSGKPATPARTLYQMLHVDPYADPDVIEAAFKRLALKYHPDRSKALDAPEKMREILRAKEILGDPARRRAYDDSIGIVHLPKLPDAMRADDV